MIDWRSWLIPLFAVLVAVLINFFLKLLAKHEAFHWLEGRGSGLPLLNPFPTPCRYVFVYLGAAIALVFAVVFFR